MELQFLKWSGVIGMIGILCISFNPSWADPEDQYYSFACADSANVMDCIEKTKPLTTTETSPQNIPLNTQRWGITGPLGLAVRYDADLGWIPELNLVQMFYDNGISVQLGYGFNEQRANITLGHTISPQQQLKITYEYLSQNLPFDFAGGEVDEWVNQNAFGAAYRYLLLNRVLHSIELNGYYIHANNKDLSDDIFYDGNEAYLDLRHIAGGVEETVTAGVTLTAPTYPLLCNLGIGYSHLAYDTEYEDDQNTATLAFNAGLDYLITNHTQFSTRISNSAAETDENIKISQIFPAQFEVSLAGHYSQGQAGQPNSRSITLTLAYPVASYRMKQEDRLSQLKTWIQQPVIRAPRVLAIKDEKIIQMTINAANPPAQSLMTGQMIQSINTQDIFNFDPATFDNVVYSLSFPADSHSLGNPQNQLYIDVKPNDNSSYYATVYSTAPLPNSATPNGGQAVYHLIITASGYKNGLTTPIQAQADLQLNINFNPNNEPQWDKNKTSGAIAFDQTTAPSSINLNSYLLSNTPEAVEFYFKDASQYPNWQLIESSGAWYLVRKTTGSGAYNAADVNTSPTLMIYVKYQDDPVNIPPADADSQALTITVKPDDAIQLQWNTSSACQLAPMTATQPAGPSQTIGLLNQCVVYTKNGAAIAIANDVIGSITEKSDYHGVINISDNKMTVNNPAPADMANSWDIVVSVNSAAAGYSQNVLEPDGKNLKIPVNSNLMVNGDSSNTAAFSDPNFQYAAIYVSKLAAIPYQFADSQIVNPDLNLNNPLVCPGKITNSDSFTGCQHYNQGAAPLMADSNGNATLIWAYNYGHAPTTISWISLVKANE